MKAQGLAAALCKSEQIQFVDLGTFNRLTSDVLEVIESITGDGQLSERTTR